MFGQRRKTLLNALQGAGFGREELLPALNAAAIDPGVRGETLSLADFARLSDCLAPLLPDSGS